MAFGDAADIWAPVHQKLAQRAAIDADLKKQQLGHYWDAYAQDPESPMGQWAHGEFQKLLPSETRKKWLNIAPLVGKFLGKHKEPVPAPSGPQLAPDAETMRNYRQGREQEGLDLAQKKSDIEQNRQIAVAKAKPANRGTFGKPTEYRDPNNPDAPPIWVKAQSGTGTYHNLQGEPVEMPEGYIPYTAPKEGRKVDVRFTDAEGKEHLLKQDTFTMKTYDIHGDPTNIPDDWEPVDEQAKLAKIRTEGFGTGPLNVAKKSYMALNPEATEQEAERMAATLVLFERQRAAEQKGATTTPAVKSVNPETGQVVQLPPVRNINPVPAEIRNQQPQPPSHPVLQERQPVPAPGGEPAAAVPADGAAKAAPQGNAQAGGRTVGLNPSEYRMAQQDIRAILAASMPILGDPTQPDVTSLADFADLASNPSAVRRIGSALKVIEGLQGADLGAAHAGGSAGGVSINLGALGDVFQNRLGLTRAAASSKVEVLNEALNSMTPREREYYNTLLSAREAVMGIRRGIGSGITNAQVERFISTLPAIGEKNVVDRAGYERALRQHAGTIKEMLRGQLNVYTPEQRKVADYINSYGNERTRASAPKPAAPKATPKPAAPKKGAVEDGYEFLGGDAGDQNNWRKK